MAQLGEIQNGAFAKISPPDVGEIWLPYEEALLAGMDLLEIEGDTFGTYAGRELGWTFSIDIVDAQAEAELLGAEVELN